MPPENAKIPRTQIPRDQLKVGTWYAGRGRNANVALGADWPTFKDEPHTQWGAPMRRSPSSEAAALFASGGFAAVWAAVEAV